MFARTLINQLARPTMNNEFSRSILIPHHSVINVTCCTGCDYSPFSANQVAGFWSHAQPITHLTPRSYLSHRSKDLPHSPNLFFPWSENCDVNKPNEANIPSWRKVRYHPCPCGICIYRVRKFLGVPWELPDPINQISLGQQAISVTYTPGNPVCP